jgi:hypothetical protein
MPNVVQQHQLAKANGEQEVKTIVKDIEKRRVKTRSDQRAKKAINVQPEVFNATSSFQTKPAKCKEVRRWRT